MLGDFVTQFLIITSKEDKASINIREQFLKSNLFQFVEADGSWHDNPVFKLENMVSMKDHSQFFKDNQIYLGLTDSPLIFLDDLKLKQSNLAPDFLIFASRHRTDDTSFGGKAKQISKTSALMLKAAFHSLRLQLLIPNFNEFADYSLDLEVTHHGPTTLEKPLIFIELGSSESEWEIENAGKLVSQAVINTCIEYLELKQNKYIQIGIGFGGTHYAPQFQKLIRDTNVAISFICPKYCIQSLDKKLVEQMIKNTVEKVNCFIVDWKGVNAQDKQHLIPILEKFDIPIKKTKDF